MSNRGVRRRVARDEAKARKAAGPLPPALRVPKGVTEVECDTCHCTFGVTAVTVEKFAQLGRPFRCFGCSGAPYKVIKGG